jgi:hypothetical protein
VKAIRAVFRAAAQGHRESIEWINSHFLGFEQLLARLEEALTDAAGEDT